MPVIGETVTLVGNEYIGVESITYGDVTLSPSDLNVYESEDTITFETGEDRVRLQVKKWAISTTDKMEAAEAAAAQSRRKK